MLRYLQLLAPAPSAHIARFTRNKTDQKSLFRPQSVEHLNHAF